MTRRWAACASRASVAGKARRASTATPRRRPSRRSGCCRSAPCSACRRRRNAKTLTLALRLLKKLAPSVTGPGLRLRRPGRRVGVRGLGLRAAAHREGLPGRGPRGGRALRRVHLSGDVVGPQALPLRAAARLLRDPADRRAEGLRDPVRCRRRRRLAGLRQHALRAARRLLPRPVSGATSPTGGTSWRRTTTRPSGCSASSTNPTMTPSDEVMKQVADEMGVGDTFRRTPVGVLFGGSGAAAGSTVADPYFGGAGPERRTCIECGECMTGCRHHAKNTLTKNYLHLAERAGANNVSAPCRWLLYPPHLMVLLRSAAAGRAVPQTHAESHGSGATSHVTSEPRDRRPSAARGGKLPHTRPR